MTLFSRILGRRERSRLAKFLDRLTPDSIRRASQSPKETETRIATLISLTVLRVAADFGRDVTAATEQFTAKMKAPRGSAPVFDITVFDCAAFCHYTLIAHYLPEPDADEELDDEDDPLFEVLRAAARLSSGLITSHCDFGLADDFFLNRMLSYNFAVRNRGNVFSRFQAVLAASIEGGSPRAGRSDKLSLDLPLSLGLAATVLPFCTTMLPALKEVARNAYDHADELGLLA